MLTHLNGGSARPAGRGSAAIPGMMILVGLAACGPAATAGGARVQVAGGPGTPAAPGGPWLPAIPEVRGELRIDVVHPGANATMTAVDSTFVFGSLGRGDATLTINGEGVPVAPNGAWLAYLPVPPDGVYRISASAAGQTVTATHTIRVPAPLVDDGALRVVAGTAAPVGTLTFVRGERVEVSVRGTAGARARLVLPNGTVVPLTERAALDRSTGFMLDATREQLSTSEYVGSFELTEAIATTDPAVAAPTLADSAWYAQARAGLVAEGAMIELTRGAEIVRHAWNAAIGVIEPGRPRVAIAATARSDSTVIGRRQLGADQAWDFFWPNGTRLAIDGEAEGFYRVRLGWDLSAWVAQGDVRLLPEGAPPPRAFVGPSIQLTRTAEGVDARFSLATPIPFRVIPNERGIGIEFYGGTGQPAYVGYPPGDDFVDRLDWNQPTDDLFRFDITLNELLWGFRSRWDGPALIVSVRRPPGVDPASPLRGMRVGVDAGHRATEADIGAIGPTRLTEAEANAAVAARLAAMLETAGAEAVQLRPGIELVPLADRPVRADREDLDLLVSIHFNAFPDGVNPFTNYGTTMFQYWPQSLDLARLLQMEILREFGLPDRGVRFQNLAMPRTSWMPAVLTESFFLMFPEQEAGLRRPEVVERVAAAHFRAIESFLAGVVETARGNSAR